MLKEVLKKEYIRVNEEAKDWKEAVIKANQPLLENHCIKESYIDNSIKMVKELGPYIVIAPGIAISHARCEGDVMKDSISVVTLSTPVEFGHEQNDPVKCVFALAAKDSNGHMAALSDLAISLSNHEKYQKIFNAQTVDELYDCLVN